MRRVVTALLALPSFLLLQLLLSGILGRLVDWWWLDNNPDWYAGPLGGIHQLPVFVLVLPVAAWMTYRLFRGPKNKQGKP